MVAINKLGPTIDGDAIHLAGLDFTTEAITCLIDMDIGLPALHGFIGCGQAGDSTANNGKFGLLLRV
jgi:hypothetical protein